MPALPRFLPAGTATRYVEQQMVTNESPEFVQLNLALTRREREKFKELQASLGWSQRRTFCVAVETLLRVLQEVESNDRFQRDEG